MSFYWWRVKVINGDRVFEIYTRAKTVGRARTEAVETVRSEHGGDPIAIEAKFDGLAS